MLGKKRNTADEYEWIYHALDVITTLDPQYDYAYYVGVSLLTNLANRVDLSNRLLEKGFRENPTVWNIPFLLGYNHYLLLAMLLRLLNTSPPRRGYQVAQRICLALRHACMQRRTTLKPHSNF